MTTVSIMQPYFFPYIGYYQLIAASDVFVLYDDAQYIRSGWSNRNRIQRDGSVHYLTLPVEKADFRLPYRARRYKFDAGSRDQVVRSVREAYRRRAPRYEKVMPLVERLMAFPDATVSAFNRNIIVETAAMLGIGTRIIESSELETLADLTGPARVIGICRQLGAERYVNMAGGAHLYGRAAFAEACLELRFLRPAIPPYEQGVGEFAPGLSIIDILMFNEPEAIRPMLSAYELD